MKKVFLLFVWILSVVFGTAQEKQALIPQPVSLEWGTGNYQLPTNPEIFTGGNDSLSKIASQLAARIKTACGYEVTIKETKPTGTGGIHFILSGDQSIPKEGYHLLVGKEGVELFAAEPAGIFYGLQTLLQLFPKEITSNQKTNLSSWTLPAVSIRDHPRFGWRGLMLDVSRHFFTVAQVKEFIDLMVQYKFNLLHLHLTDDQGWRIQIKSLPKLTEVGAWRVDKTGTFGTFSKAEPGEPRNYGGFYTHEDIRDLVKYAGERFVDILPEIDVPGHSLAALASYPELSCTPGHYEVSSGEKFMEWPTGGHFYGLLDNTLCPANEKVYSFMDKVFTEVAQLFPFEYIHMGGDETARNFWEKSAAIKAMMKKENLKSLDEVQSYFVKRMEKIIRAKGKKMIGWDEILQGGLAPNAAVMSWRGTKGGIEAIKLGREVVMSPNDFFYLDLMQGDKIVEPPVYSSIRLKKTYQFEPVPPGVNPAFIKGGQGNLWTEQIYNMRHAQYMMWPRAFAVAEILWSPADKRDWNNFVSRIEKHFERFDVAGIKYAPSMYDPIFEVGKNEKGQVIVKLITEVEGLSIHYSFDNSFPDQFYPKFKKYLIVPKDASTMKVITYRDNKPVGRMLVMPVDELKKRAGLKMKPL
ncbi:MAG TPA: beta-N-acetylhexosaminidase [Chitinophagaceae bacterium]|nr:beta-N-acetylhexosaminidase [Chitinophagaceae bacterium]